VTYLFRRASGFTTRSDIGPAREGPSAEVIAYVTLIYPPPLFLFIFFSEAQERRGEEVTVDPEQFQDPDNEYGLFAGTTYEQDDEEADKIYDSVDDAMDSRRKARRCVKMVSFNPCRSSNLSVPFFPQRGSRTSGISKTPC
jgi:pre-mRNA-processing factor 6